MNRGRHPGWKKTFSGSGAETSEQYLYHLEYYAYQCGLSEQDKISLLIASLEGKAARVVTQLTAWDTWNDVIQKLDNICNPPERRNMLSATFEQRMRASTESAEQYSLVLEDLANRAFGHYDRELVKERVRMQFLRGQPHGLRQRLATQRFTHIEEMVTAVMMAEAYGQEDVKSPSRGTKVRTINDFDMNDNLRESFAMIVAQLQEIRAMLNLPAQPINHGLMYPVEKPRFRSPPRQTRMVSDSPPLRPSPPVRSHRTTGPPEGTEVSRWLSLSLCLTPVDCGNEYDEEDIYAIMEAKVPEAGRQQTQMSCFYCKQAGHGWRRCFKLRDLLKKNGMRTTYIPRRDGPAATTSNPAPTPISVPENPEPVM